MKKLPLLLSLFLIGCPAHQYPQRIRFKDLGLNIILADAEQVDKHCRKGIDAFDDGTPISEGKIACCYQPPKGPDRNAVIFVSRQHIDCIFHELCHYEGATDCSNFDVKDVY